MMQTIKSKFTKLRDTKASPAVFSVNTAVTGALFAMLMASMPIDAMAQSMANSFDIPFITDFGCSVVKWMKGPLSILIFVVVSVATLVIGMISKMDWGRIISVCVVFGIILALGNVLSGSSYVTGKMQACLQN